jgi:hypothetical protein
MHKASIKFGVSLSVPCVHELAQRHIRVKGALLDAAKEAGLAGDPASPACLVVPS